MRCETCRELMLAYVKDELEEGQKADFEEHIAQCVDCAKELEGSRTVLGIVEGADKQPIVKLAKEIIQGAIQRRASDIHIERTHDRTRVRLRVDGVMHEIMEIPADTHQRLIGRIKVMAEMDVAERRVPQDGRIHVRYGNKDYDLRVSCGPSVTGETVVMRVLSKADQEQLLDLDRLGMCSADVRVVKELLVSNRGLVIAAAPTGSGTTTTLYAMLSHVQKPEIKIMTVEDPVEMTIDGITQVHVNQKAGLNFSRALRYFLRQDPDIIMCGEIRDLESAEVVTQAAMTGHLVLSTLHTKDAASVIRRLVDIGVVRFMIADSLLGAVAQRLARLLCTECKQERAPTREEIAWLRGSGIEDIPDTLATPVGCEKCKQTGYRGRTGVFEIVVVDDELKAMIAEERDLSEVEDLARSRLHTMRQDAAEKVTQGLFDVAEAMRVLSSTV